MVYQFHSLQRWRIAQSVSQLEVWQIFVSFSVVSAAIAGSCPLSLARGGGEGGGEGVRRVRKQAGRRYNVTSDL